MRATALAALVGALLVAGSTHASSERQARLVFASDTPLVVAGTGFRAHERVRLLISPGASTRVVRAGSLGRFRVTLRASMPRCGGIVVQALGSRGSRAMVDRTGVDCASID